MVILPIVPFILMLTKSIELIPKQYVQGNADHRRAIITKGEPTEAEIGPMYAELVGGSINNKVKVYFLVSSEKYYYQVESSNESNIVVTKVCLIM